MKKKAISEPVISPEILEMAKRSVEPERVQLTKPCAVCGAPCKPQSAAAHAAGEEDLCWVCRRLKISAWRENEQQMPAQE